ncbi:uncharacterized protein NPIL_620951, partial [Nephila pilipes]
MNREKHFSPPNPSRFNFCSGNHRLTGSIGVDKHTGQPKTSRSNIGIKAVRESVGESPGTSTKEYNILVDNIQKDVILNAEDDRRKNELLQGELTSKLVNGQAKFVNISFIQTGKSFKLSVSSSGPSEIVPWLSNPISVIERKLFLRPSGRRLPISPRENDTLSPAAGVIIYDVLNNAPADRKYLSKYTWEGSIGLLYDDVYPGKILGSTIQMVENRSNEILFNDIVLSSWGYSYVLKINIRAKETNYWNLTCLI